MPEEPEPYAVKQLRKAIEYFEKGNFAAANDACRRAMDDMPADCFLPGPPEGVH